MNKKKLHGGSNINSLASSFEEKNSFFYNNAIDIIESKDRYNKYSFLDLLGNITEKNKMKVKKKIKVKKSKNEFSPKNSKFYLSATTFNSPTNTQMNFFCKSQSQSQRSSPNKFLMTNLKIKNPTTYFNKDGHGLNGKKNKKTEKTYYFNSQANFMHQNDKDKDKEIQQPVSIFCNISSGMPNLNLNNHSETISQNSQQEKQIFSPTRLSRLNLEKHLESIKKMKVINKTLSNFTRIHEKNMEDKTDFEVENLVNSSRFYNTNANSGNNNDFRSKSEKNYFSHRKKDPNATIYKDQSCKSRKNSPERDRSPKRFSQGIFGEMNFNAKLKKMKFEAEKPVKKNTYDVLRSLNIKEKKPNFQEIGKMKILKIPEKFKLKEFEIKVHHKSNSLVTEQDMMRDFYKIKNSKDMKKEDYWDKLSNPNPEVYSNKIKYFSSDEKENSSNALNSLPGSTFLNFNQCTIPAINQNTHRNFLLHNLENIKSFEKTHLKLKNKILKVRKKFQNSSYYVNPKHIVSLPQDEEEN